MNAWQILLTVAVGFLLLYLVWRATAGKEKRSVKDLLGKWKK